jgi:hypothetical protein
MPQSHELIALSDLEDVVWLPHQQHERDFAAALLANVKEYQIFPEPQRFDAVRPDGTIRSTIPDFLIRDPETGREAYVEITEQQKTRKLDPKRRQRRIMEQAAPDKLYIVLYKPDAAMVITTSPFVPIDIFAIENVKKQIKQQTKENIVAIPPANQTTKKVA